MKKLWRVFWILTVLGAAALSTGAVFAARFSGVLCAVLVAAGAAAWTYLFLRFRAIEYYVENERIVIRGGVLIKSERTVPKPSVLWTTTVKIGSAVLFTVLHTASGKIAVFAKLSKH